MPSLPAKASLPFRTESPSYPTRMASQPFSSHAAGVSVHSSVALLRRTHRSRFQPFRAFGPIRGRCAAGNHRIVPAASSPAPASLHLTAVAAFKPCCSSNIGSGRGGGLDRQQHRTVAASAVGPRLGNDPDRGDNGVTAAPTASNNCNDSTGSSSSSSSSTSSHTGSSSTSSRHKTSSSSGNGGGKSGGTGNPNNNSSSSSSACRDSYPPYVSGVLDNSSITSMDWDDCWQLDTSPASSSSTSSLDAPCCPSASSLSDSGDCGGCPLASRTSSPANPAQHPQQEDGKQDSGSNSGSECSGCEKYRHSSSSSNGEGLMSEAASGANVTTIRIAFHAVAASFDRNDLEWRLKELYGSQAVRKYPDVIHCQLSKGRECQPGADAFFFDYGVVACWGLMPDVERHLVQELAVQCAIQPLPQRDRETDVFRCAFTSNPAAAAAAAAAAGGNNGGSGGGGGGLTLLAPEPPPAESAPAAPLPAIPLPPVPVIDLEAPGSSSSGGGGGGGSSNPGGTTSGRRLTRRAERIGSVVAAVTSSSAAAAAAAIPCAPAVTTTSQLQPQTQPQQPEQQLAAQLGAEAGEEAAPPPSLQSPAGPYSLVSFPPQITDDTVLLHVRCCGDTATLLAVSYALAQSTKLSAFEKAVSAMVDDTRGLPEALAEHGEVHLSGREIGRLIGKVFVLKRSVNLMGSVAGTPEFFWSAPDQLQALYGRLTEYVELGERVEQLNGRFAVLQEMLELLRAQEENRHGNRLELVVIWLIVVEVVLGVFELLDLFGVIGPQHGGGGFI